MWLLYRSLKLVAASPIYEHDVLDLSPEISALYITDDVRQFPSTGQFVIPPRQLHFLGDFEIALAFKSFLLWPDIIVSMLLIQL